jgi:hypothetical protein
MKRAIYVFPIVLCLAIAILPSLIGQSNQGPHFPVAVASKTIQSDAPIPETLLFVPTVTGLYRLSANLEPADCGNGISSPVALAFFTWTDEYDHGQQFQVQECGNNEAVVLVAKAGDPINFNVNVYGTLVSPHPYTLRLVVERL